MRVTFQRPSDGDVSGRLIAGALGGKMRISLDGVVQQGVVAFDIGKGELERLVYNAEGRPQVDPADRSKALTETVRGVVRVEATSQSDSDIASQLVTTGVWAILIGWDANLHRTAERVSGVQLTRLKQLMAHYVETAIAEEREACARICETTIARDKYEADTIEHKCAAAIRGRGVTLKAAA